MIEIEGFTDVSDGDRQMEMDGKRETEIDGKIERATEKEEKADFILFTYLTVHNEKLSLGV